MAFRRPRWLWLLALLLLIPFLAGGQEAVPSPLRDTSPPDPAPALVKPDFNGIYVFDERASDDIQRAIEATVSKMGFIVRPIARGRLKKDNPAFKRVEIRHQAETIVIANDGLPVRTPSEGTRVAWPRPDGATFTVSTRPEGGAWVQRFWAKDGVRTNTYTLSPDGQTLTMAVEITSPRLPQPLKYQLVYQRVM